VFLNVSADGDYCEQSLQEALLPQLITNFSGAHSRYPSLHHSDRRESSNDSRRENVAGGDIGNETGLNITIDADEDRLESRWK
jgi:hypothetical protein